MKVQRALGLNANKECICMCEHTPSACHNLYASNIFTCTCEHAPSACHNLLFVIHAVIIVAIF